MPDSQGQQAKTNGRWADPSGGHSSGRNRASKKSYAAKDKKGSASWQKNKHNKRRPQHSGQDFSSGSRRGGQRLRMAREEAAAQARGEGRPAFKAPDLDSDVTGRELDGAVRRELRALEKDNAETVAKHLVMTGRYLDIDPAFALEHAKAAGRRAGRISAVREAVGIAAYAAEDFETSLRELRTHRRMSGSHEHLALLIDNERALGRTDKALELAQESAQLNLSSAQRVEIALVVSGIYRDRGDLAAASKALEIPELNSKRGYDYSPRLFTAYAELQEQAGKVQEAKRWHKLALVTEAALGQGDFAEPEIFDIFGEAELFEPLEEEESQEETAEHGQQKQEEIQEDPLTQAETETELPSSPGHKQTETGDRA